MVPISNIIYTTYSYVAILILAIVYSVPALIVICLPVRYRCVRTVAYAIVRSFYFLAQKISLLRIEYTGIANVPNQPVIFVANHQSSMDIPLLGLLAGAAPHIWLTRKDVLDDFWFIGPLISRLSIFIDVSTPRQSMASLLRVIRFVRNAHYHIMIFPEGSRFLNGVINNFYGGFVLLSRHLNRPVLPVYIDGIQNIYPPHSHWARWGMVKITVGAPMSLGNGESDEHFKQRVHQWFLDQVK